MTVPHIKASLQFIGPSRIPLKNGWRRLSSADFARYSTSASKKGKAPDRSEALPTDRAGYIRPGALMAPILAQQLRLSIQRLGGAGEQDRLSKMERISARRLGSMGIARRPWPP